MNQRIGIGLIGAGRIGKRHAENIATRIAGASLVAVADVNEQAAESTAVRWGAESAHSDYRPLLEDPAIQAVAICSASDTHTQAIQDAASAGKHIFCEKPIGHDLSQIDQALAAVEAAGVRLQIGFNRRFDPSFRRLKELLVDGRIGQPQLLRITSRDPEPPPADYLQAWGGIFLETTIHDFDMARWLVGSEVTEIYVAGDALVVPDFRSTGDVDTAVITLRFASGALGTIDNSLRAVYGYDQRIEVFGSDGMLAAGNKYPDATTLSDSTGVHASRPLYFFLERYTESFQIEMEEFVACVIEDKPTPVEGQEGRIPIVMALAAQLSLEEGRPVKLDEITP